MYANGGGSCTTGRPPATPPEVPRAAACTLYRDVYVPAPTYMHVWRMITVDGQITVRTKFPCLALDRRGWHLASRVAGKKLVHAACTWIVLVLESHDSVAVSAASCSSSSS
jgi:hypothetical protein